MHFHVRFRLFRRRLPRSSSQLPFLQGRYCRSVYHRPRTCTTRWRRTATDAAVCCGQGHYQYRRKPYPQQLAADGTAAPKIRQIKTDIGHWDRPPVPVATRKRPEEWNVLAASGEGVEQPVGRDDGREQRRQHPPLSPKRAVQYARCDHARRQCEDERVGNTAMPERAAIGGLSPKGVTPQSL